MTTSTQPYIAWVQASSKNQAMVKAGALAGQEKNRRNQDRTGREQGAEGLMEPDIWIEKIGLDEYWDHREEVEIEKR